MTEILGSDPNKKTQKKRSDDHLDLDFFFDSFVEIIVVAHRVRVCNHKIMYRELNYST